jgi:hypothetical protein
MQVNVRSEYREKYGGIVIKRIEEGGHRDTFFAYWRE